MNYWFWTYIILVPVLVLSATPRHPRWWRQGRLLAAIIACYLLINLAEHLMWDFRRAEIDSIPDPTAEDFGYATPNGASFVFVRIFGWVSAATYVGWWEMAWRLIYRKIIANKKIIMNLSSRIIGFSICVSFFVALITSLTETYPTSIELFFHIILPQSLHVIYR